MKRVLVLLAIFLLSCYVSSAIAQVKEEKIVIKQTATNLYELKGKLYGNFKELEVLPNKSSVETYLRENYDIGFTFSQSKGGFNVPMGKLNRWINNPSGKDTLVFTSTITNPRMLKHYCSVWFKNKSNYFKADLSTAKIGKNISDYLCEPISVSLSENKLFAEKNDTVQIFASADMEDECNQILSYSWEFKQDTSSIDSVVALGDWKKWNDKRSGHIEIADDYIKFQVLNKKWDRRRWRAKASSGIGNEVNSGVFILRVGQ